MMQGTYRSASPTLPLLIRPLRDADIGCGTLLTSTLKLPLREREPPVGLMSTVRWSALPALRRGDLMFPMTLVPTVRLLLRLLSLGGGAVNEDTLAVLEARERECSDSISMMYEGVGLGGYSEIRDFRPVGVDSRSSAMGDDPESV